MPKKKNKIKTEIIKQQEIKTPEVIKKDMPQTLDDVGMDQEAVAKMLLELCNWKSIKLDKNGQVTEFVDGALRMKALDLWSRLTGNSRANPTKEEHKHIHVSEEKLNALASRAKDPTPES